MTVPDIHHIIVLMMENRSFDHMLGSLNHPNANYEGLKKAPADLKWLENKPAIINDQGTINSDPGPDHSHLGVMWQLTGNEALSYPAPYTITNDGFAQQHEKFALKETHKPNKGENVVHCLSPDRLPILSQLALDFCVFDHWFCSVPGETWPNRNFAHAGTSDGEVNISKRPYFNKTVFELISDARASWGIYHDGPPQAWAFPKLWDLPWRNHFHGMDSFFDRIADGRLPHYSFVEPKHFFDGSNSQHPGKNVDDPADFNRGEQLIGQIYNALVRNPDLFERTLFLITYDEHGGYYDHVKPPIDPAYQTKAHESGFKFDLLGVRVPAVLISPFLKPASLDSRIFDHSSIAATVGALFAPKATPPGRAGRANRFIDKDEQSDLWLNAPRTLQELPNVSGETNLAVTLGIAASANPHDTPNIGTADDVKNFDEFQDSLLYLTALVDTTVQLEESTGRPVDVEMVDERIKQSQLVSESAPAMVPSFVDSAMLRFRESVR